jgi:hypothetical protein
VNGNFEPGFKGVCPWSFRWGESVALDTTVFKSGTASARVHNRQYTWQGISQDVTGKIRKDVTYRLTGAVRMINTISTNKNILAAKMEFEFPNSVHQYPTLFYSDQIPKNGSWLTINTTWTLTSATLASWGYTDTDIIEISFYFESPGQVNVEATQFWVDELSLVPVSIFIR